MIVGGGMLKKTGLVFFVFIVYVIGFLKLDCTKTDYVILNEFDNVKSIGLYKFFDIGKKTLNLTNTHLTETTFRLYYKQINGFIEENRVERLLLENNQFKVIPMELFSMLFSSGSLRFVSLNNSLLPVVQAVDPVFVCDASLIFDTTIQFDRSNQCSSAIIKKIVLCDNLRPLYFFQKNKSIKICGDLRYAYFFYVYAVDFLSFWLNNLFNQ
jgi:hypothetical protein